MFLKSFKEQIRKWEKKKKMEIPIKFKTIEKLLKKTYFSNNLNPEMQLSEMPNYTCAIQQCFLLF